MISQVNKYAMFNMLFHDIFLIIINMRTCIKLFWSNSYWTGFVVDVAERGKERERKKSERMNRKKEMTRDTNIWKERRIHYNSVLIIGKIYPTE